MTKIEELKPLDILTREDYEGKIIIVKCTDEYVYTSIGAIPIEQLHLYSLVTGGDKDDSIN